LHRCASALGNKDRRQATATHRPTPAQDLTADAVQ
jgi:hypothetical protein